MNHSVSDFIIRIKNASMARRKTVMVPSSKMNKALSAVLTKEGFLKNVKEETVEGKKTLVASIAYKNRQPVFTNVKIYSKPSVRQYKAKVEIPKLERRGAVTAIFSTNQGVLTGKEAVKKGVGGELLFTLW